MSLIDPQSTEITDDQASIVGSDLPYMGLDVASLTMQQEKLVLGIASGMTVAAAGRAAGYASACTSLETSKTPNVVKALAYYREQLREEVHFEVVHAHGMYMDAFASSANATEMKNTTDSLVKLHGLAVERPQTQVNIQINGSKQLERMSDEDLLKLVGQDEAYLEPKSDLMSETDETDENAE